MLIGSSLHAEPLHVAQVLSSSMVKMENGKWKMENGLAYAEPSIQGKLKFITCAVLQKILAKTCGYNPAVFGTHDLCHDIPDALCNPKVGMRNV